MSNSLRQHGPKEVYKQLYFSVKSHGLETIKIHVGRQAGKIKVDFTGSPEDVTKAQAIYAAWA